MKQLEVIDDFAASTTPEIESEYREEWMPPEAIAHLKARTVDELSEELGALDFRWRLDAYHVIQDYLG